MKDPPQVPKESAAWFIRSTFAAADARTNAVQKAHGSFWWLAADIDEGDLSIGQVAAAFDAVVPGTWRLVYASRSATPDDRRWRVLLPLASPVAGVDYEDTAAAFFDVLEEESAARSSPIAPWPGPRS